MPRPVRLPILGASTAERSGDSEGTRAPIAGRRPNVVSMMQVGDLARESGKTVRAIHLYEELGLLRPETRSKGRYRLYGSDALVRIRWIGKLQDMGFSLSEIQTVVRDWEQQASASAPGAMERMREVYKNKLLETREQIRKLQELEHELESSLQYLDTCDVCDPQRLLSACTCCDLHDTTRPVPDLVAGFRAHKAPQTPQRHQGDGKKPSQKFEPRPGAQIEPRGD